MVVISWFNNVLIMGHVDIVHQDVVWHLRRGSLFLRVCAHYHLQDCSKCHRECHCQSPSRIAFACRKWAECVPNARAVFGHGSDLSQIGNAQKVTQVAQMVVQNRAFSSKMR